MKAPLVHRTPAGGVHYNYKPGHIYKCDCLELLNGLPDNYIDLTVTSPPYDNLRDYHGYSFPFEAIARELYRVTAQGGVVVWVVGDATINGSETGTSFRQALCFMECGFNLHDTMIYARHCAYPGNTRYSQDFEYMFVFSKGTPKTINIIKDQLAKQRGRPAKKHSKLLKSGKRVTEKGNRVRPKYKERSNIWNLLAGGGHCTKDLYAHKQPAIFPEKLALDHIISWSNPGDIVADIFTGSGTTQKMAILTGRQFIGSEVSEAYHRIALKRIAQAKAGLMPRTAAEVKQAGGAWSLFDQT